MVLETEVSVRKYDQAHQKLDHEPRSRTVFEVLERALGRLEAHQVPDLTHHSQR